MNEEDKEPEIKVETTITPAETNAEIIAEKAEVIIDRAETAVAIIEQTANIAIAEAVIDAEQQIAEHEDTVKKLEYDNEWLQNQLNQISSMQEQMAIRITDLESKQSTPIQSEVLPTTVEIVEGNGSGAEGDPQSPQPTPLEETIETLAEVPDKIKRKIKVL